METVWIIGFGHFGEHAAKQLRKLIPRPHITAVDPDMARLARWQKTIHTICADGVGFVLDNMADGSAPVMIVPALPIHLAFEFVVRRMAPARRLKVLPVPESVAETLPNPIRGGMGEIYVSHADFRCPDTCAEPAAVCTVTGKPRKSDMYKMLQIVDAPYTSVAIRSRQLAPGVGGYIAQALLHAERMVEKMTGHVLLSTACRCHGVMHAFKLDA